MTYLKGEYAVSERRACRVMSMNRSSCRHRGRGVVDAETAEVVRLSRRYPYWGYRKIHALPDRDRCRVGREWVRLIRRREGLRLVRKHRRRKVLG